MLPACPTSVPISALLDILSGPWTTVILWAIRCEGSLRFNELRRKLPGASSRILTERLRLLESAGLLFRQHEPTIPPQVTYGFTREGKGLVKALDALGRFADAWYTPDRGRLSQRSKAKPAAGKVS